MTETFTRHHHHVQEAPEHHNHSCEHSAELQPFPAAAENVLLRLSQDALSGKLPNHMDSASLPPGTNSEQDEIITATRDRLGDAYPRLSADQEVAVHAAFGSLCSQLPKSHPRYDHSPDHAPDDHCGKTHGPLRRRMHDLEHAIVGLIPQQKARVATAVAFRAIAFLFCPGDDIAAIGLQAYSSFSGHGHHVHEHDEPSAILPRRPSIDFKHKKATIRLPIDVPIPHKELPDTPEAAVIKVHADDPRQQSAPVRPRSAKSWQERMAYKPKYGHEQEHAPSRWRVAAGIGAAALAMVGGC